MNRLRKLINLVVFKYGSFVAGLAFFAVTVAANSPCNGPFYEPKAPVGLNSFKKFNK